MLLITQFIQTTHLLENQQQDMLMNLITQCVNYKKLTPSDEISSDNYEDDDLDDSSRLKNLHWCRCKNHCVILHILLECKCCRGYENNKVLESAFLLHQRRNLILKEFDKILSYLLSPHLRSCGPVVKALDSPLKCRGIESSYRPSVLR